MPESNRVLLDKEVLDQYVANFEIEKEIEVPELAEILDQENPVIKVRGASLDDHIKCKELSSTVMLLLGTVLNAVSKGESVDPEEVLAKLQSEEQLHPNTSFEIDIFRTCVIEPKFNVQEVISLSEKIPEFVNRVVKEILGITALEE